MYRPALIALCLPLLAACNLPYRGFTQHRQPAVREAPPPAPLRFVQEPLGTCRSTEVRPLREAPVAGRRDDDSVWL